VAKSEGKRSLGDLDVGQKIILRWILERYYGVVWTGLTRLRIESSRRLL
jgi:hypothetical protein